MKCEKHPDQDKVQINYGRGKWGWECLKCRDEDRETIRQMFTQLFGIEKKPWWRE